MSLPSGCISRDAFNLLFVLFVVIATYPYSPTTSRRLSLHQNTESQTTAKPTTPENDEITGTSEQEDPFPEYTGIPSQTNNSIVLMLDKHENKDMDAVKKELMLVVVVGVVAGLTMFILILIITVVVIRRYVGPKLLKQQLTVTALVASQLTMHVFSTTVFQKNALSQLTCYRSRDILKVFII